MINNKFLTSLVSVSLLMNGAYVSAFAEAQNSGVIINDGVLVSVSGVNGELVIPEGVTSIKNDAFINNQYGITKVKVPGTIKNIEPITFAYLRENLTEIEFEDGVESIGIDNFRLCSKLEKVKLPSTLKFLAGGAFSECASLKSVEIPEGIEELHGYTFSGCTNLAQVKLPSSMSTFGADDFRGTPWLESLKDNEGYVIYKDNLVESPKDLSGDVVIPSGVKIIGAGAFRNRNITKVEIPEGVEEIGESAFMGCFELEEVKLPNSLKKIDNQALVCGMSLKTIDLPEGLESIGDNAFDGLLEVTIPDSIKSISATAFGSNTKINGNTELYDKALQEYKESLKNVCIADKHRCVEGWNHLYNGTVYLKADGEFQTGWMKCNDKIFYFRKNCSMVTGFYTIDDKTYYFDETQGDNYGCMAFGWREVDGKWYYFSGLDGSMAVNTYIDGYYVNEQGQLVI